MTHERTDRPIPASPANPDHHLWRNGRVWWVAFTFHTHEGKKHRVRRSLATVDVLEARDKRDALLAQYASRPGWKLALRFVPPRGRREPSARAPRVGLDGFRVQPLSA